MNKNGLFNILTEVLKPSGFKRKGNYWVINSDEITKMVNLQKSQFGSRYYINFGYVINSIPLNGLMMHVYYRFTSSNPEEAKRIEELLDLDNTIPDTDRFTELKRFLIEKLSEKLEVVATEDDLLRYLKSQAPSILNMIPIEVKRHYNL